MRCLELLLCTGKKFFREWDLGTRPTFMKPDLKRLYILVPACSSTHSHHQPNLIVPCTTHVSGGGREQGIIKPPYQSTLSMNNIFHSWSCPRRFFHLILWTIQRSPIIRNSRKWPKIVPWHQLFSGTHNMHLTTETYMHNVIVTYMSRKAI